MSCATWGACRHFRQIELVPLLRAISLETSDAQHRLSRMHYEEFDPTDYSVVVKLRGNPPKPWKWEIYRACRSGPLESSPGFFESAGVATKEEKKGPRTFARESEIRGVTAQYPP